MTMRESGEPDLVKDLRVPSNPVEATIQNPFSWTGDQTC